MRRLTASLLAKTIDVKLRVIESGNIIMTVNANGIEKTVEAFDDEINYTGKMIFGVENNSRIVKFDNFLINTISGENIIEIADKFVINDGSEYSSQWSSEVGSKAYYDVVYTNKYDFGFILTAEKWANPGQTGLYASANFDKFDLKVSRTVKNDISSDKITLSYNGNAIASVDGTDVPDTVRYRFVNNNGSVVVYRSETAVIQQTISGYSASNYGTVQFKYCADYRLLKLSSIKMEALGVYTGEVTPDPNLYQPKTVNIVKTGKNTAGEWYKVPDGVTIYKGDTVKFADGSNVTVPDVGTGNLINVSPSGNWSGFFQVSNGQGYVCNTVGSVTLYVIGLWTGSTTVQCCMPLVTFNVSEAPQGGTGGEATVVDLVTLRKALITKSVSEFDSFYDTNGDGKLDIRDLVRLKKYLAGEDVVLG